MTECAWCGTPAATPTALSCDRCGAPLGANRHTDGSGWTELPPIPDGARLHFGNSRAQIDGLFAPMVEVNLAAGDGLLFTHNMLLWQEPDLDVRNHPMAGAWKRARAGLPLVMMEAHGPGRLGLSHDSSGEIVAVPLDRGRTIMVREHHLVAATLSTPYDALTSPVSYAVRSGNETEYEYPLGMYLDTFSADDQPGVVFLHALGNAFSRVLGPDERVVLNPSAFVMADESVTLGLAMEVPAGDSRALALLRVFGPGRVLVQSGSHGHVHRPWARSIRQWNSPNLIVHQW